MSKNLLQILLEGTSVISRFGLGIWDSNLSTYETIASNTQYLRLISQKIVSLKSTIRYNEIKMLKLLEISDSLNRESPVFDEGSLGRNKSVPVFCLSEEMMAAHQKTHNSLYNRWALKSWNLANIIQR